MFFIFLCYFVFKAKLKRHTIQKVKLRKQSNKDQNSQKTLLKAKKNFWLHDFISISVFVAHAEKEKSFVLLQYDDMQKLCSVS